MGASTSSGGCATFFHEDPATMSGAESDGAPVPADSDFPFDPPSDDDDDGAPLPQRDTSPIPSERSRKKSSRKSSSRKDGGGGGGASIARHLKKRAKATTQAVSERAHRARAAHSHRTASSSSRSSKRRNNSTNSDTVTSNSNSFDSNLASATATANTGPGDAHSHSDHAAAAAAASTSEKGSSSSRHRKSKSSKRSRSSKRRSRSPLQMVRSHLAHPPLVLPQVGAGHEGAPAAHDSARDSAGALPHTQSYSKRETVSTKLGRMKRHFSLRRPRGVPDFIDADHLAIDSDDPATRSADSAAVAAEGRSSTATTSLPATSAKPKRLSSHNILPSKWRTLPSRGRPGFFATVAEAEAYRSSDTLFTSAPASHSRSELPPLGAGFWSPKVSPSSRESLTSGTAGHRSSFSSSTDTQQRPKTWPRTSNHGHPSSSAPLPHRKASSSHARQRSDALSSPRKSLAELPPSCLRHRDSASEQPQQGDDGSISSLPRGMSGSQQRKRVQFALPPASSSSKQGDSTKEAAESTSSSGPAVENLLPRGIMLPPLAPPKKQADSKPVPEPESPPAPDKLEEARLAALKVNDTSLLDDIVSNMSTPCDSESESEQPSNAPEASTEVSGRLSDSSTDFSISVATRNSKKKRSKRRSGGVAGEPGFAAELSSAPTKSSTPKRRMKISRSASLTSDLANPTSSSSKSKRRKARSSSLTPLDPPLKSPKESKQKSKRRSLQQMRQRDTPALFPQRSS